MTPFQKAEKKQAKLRLAIFGPSGAGKTYTALRIATGIGDSIALIDTENKSACKYADRFTFDVAELSNPTIDNMVAFINQASHDVLIIDSLTHSWQDLLQEVDAIAKKKYKGNMWSAWSEGTPQQKKLVKALLDYPGHIIATMRTKTEWMTESTRDGKMKPVRVGLSPEQGKGIEYEFDMLIEINTEHFATIIKDRTGKYQDKEIDKPGEEFGKELSGWLMDGKKVIIQNNDNGKDDKKPTDTNPKNNEDNNLLVEKKNKFYKLLKDAVDDGFINNDLNTKYTKSISESTKIDQLKKVYKMFGDDIKRIKHEKELAAAQAEMGI